MKRGVLRLVRQQARSAGGDERLHDPEPRLRGLSDQHPGLQLPPDDGFTGQKTDPLLAKGCTVGTVAVPYSCFIW